MIILIILVYDILRLKLFLLLFRLFLL